MATLEQLETGLINAYDAGDMDASRRLAVIIVQERQRRSADPSIELQQQIPDSPPLQVPGTVPSAEDPTLGDKVKGVAETGLTMLSGATTGLAGHIGGAVEGIVKEIMDGEFGSYDAAQRIKERAIQRAQELTYSPETETGQEYTQALGETLAPLAAIPPLAEAQIIANTATRVPTRALANEKIVQPAKEQAERVKQVAQEIQRQVNEKLPEQFKPTPGTGTSAGSQAVDQATLRQAQAEELPVPIKLTQGQKTRDFGDQRFERETAKLPEEGAPIRERFEEQNLLLQQNMDEFIDQTGSQLTDLRGVGEAVDSALRDRAARDKRKIRTLYKDAEKAGEMEGIVRIDPLIDFLNESRASKSTAPILGVVEQELIRLKGAVRKKDGNLERVFDSRTDLYTGGRLENRTGLSLKRLEQVRKKINESTGDEKPNIRFSAQLKETIDNLTEGLGGNKYKQARAARRKYAQDYENIGLVKNLLGSKRGSDDRAIALEDVVRKSILEPSTSLDSVRQMRRLLQTEGEKGKQAWKELQGATLRHIQDQMLKGVSTNQRGDRIVSPAQLDRVIAQLDKSNKLDFIFGKFGAEQLRTINDVAKVVLTAPPGVVNTSNTATVLAGLMDVALTGSTGVPAPVATSFKLLTKSVKDKKLKARIKKTLGE